MRPDEHKKKKNAKYRKKHDIESKQANRSADKDNSTSSSTETNQVASEINVSNSYSRRVISSNWEKYEEQSKEIEQIGDDLDQIIAAAGGASSHRILESEKAWTVDQNLDEILSIDFKKLGLSLQQLPFCEMLELDESLFEPSLLELLKNQKEDSRDDSLTTPLKTFILSDYKFDFKHPARSDQSPNSSASKEVKNIETNDDQCSPEENNTVVVNASSLSEPPLKSKSNIPDVAHIEIAPLNAVTSKNIEDGNTLDTELDSLLESKPISSVNKNLSSDQASILLATEKTDEPESGNENDEQEDLEDWLDSII